MLNVKPGSEGLLAQRYFHFQRSHNTIGLRGRNFSARKGGCFGRNHSAGIVGTYDHGAGLRPDYNFRLKLRLKGIRITFFLACGTKTVLNQMTLARKEWLTRHGCPDQRSRTTSGTTGSPPLGNRDVRQLRQPAAGRHVSP